jgi:hypothetical protein
VVSVIWSLSVIAQPVSCGTFSACRKETGR